jgi:hypothetical protein
LGIRFLFVGGVFLSSGSEILFAFLDMCPNGLIYFIICIACRSVTGIGIRIVTNRHVKKRSVNSVQNNIGSAMGMSFAIIGHYFPNKISTVVAWLEVINGMGMMV